ncbi:MAG TPA: response regulator [Blastococcus sp.]|nr:response regulator [Blastococcus sp.]
MQDNHHSGRPLTSGCAGVPSVPTALVVDDSFSARARVTQLLHLGGWRVHQAVGTEDALRIAAVIQPDLVVTDMVMRRGHGATLMRRLREEGSTARFLVVAARRTHQTRALAASAGALACLAKPVDPRLFVDVMRGLTAVVAPPPWGAPLRAEPAAIGPGEAAVPAPETLLAAIPQQLSTIALSAQEGDAASVAAAAEGLASVGERLGHAEVAFLSSAIAREARRGIIPHARLMTLVDLCAAIEKSRPLVAQARRSA